MVLAPISSHFKLPHTHEDGAIFEENERNPNVWAKRESRKDGAVRVKQKSESREDGAIFEENERNPNVWAKRESRKGGAVRVKQK